MSGLRAHRDQALPIAGPLHLVEMARLSHHVVPRDPSERVDLAGGRPGTIHAIARSLATDTVLVTVAHDPRIRITYPAAEIFAAT